MKKYYNVPVIMFHSVGVAHLNWPYYFLSEEFKIFERKIDYLIKCGYDFILHDQLFHYMQDGTPIPKKSIMLTFDDGFLDNWVIVFPLLKKRGIKFTIYVSQEFVDPSSTCRPTLEDVWNGRTLESDLVLLGYLSWVEMRAMESSGLVDIQSHTSTHTWQFTGNRIIDFLHPDNVGKYPWMVWNHQLSNKPWWMVRNEKSAEELYGLPVYENARAMVARRYYEDQKVNERLIDYVRHQGGPLFFHHAAWKEKLHEVVKDFREKYGDAGRFETDDERLKRLHYELQGNKSAIERALNKKVRFLCWPGGAYNEDLLRLADEYGFNATTVKEGNNSFGNDPGKVNRISSGYALGADRFPWKYEIFTLRYYLDRFHQKHWALGLDRMYRKKCR